MALNVVIIDDQQVGIDTVEKLVNETDFLQLKHTFVDARQALLNENLANIDLIFLDINMVPINGFGFIDLLKGRARVILMASDEQYALRGYEYDEVVDFLRKPIQPGRFFKAAYKAYKLIEATRQAFGESTHTADAPERIFVKVKKEDWFIYRQIQLADILYVETVGHTLLIYLDTGENTSAKPLVLAGSVSLKTFLHEKLTQHLFLQIRRDCVVARRFIETIEGKEVVLCNKKRVVIGETYWPTVWAYVDSHKP